MNMNNITEPPICQENACEILNEILDAPIIDRAESKESLRRVIQGNIKKTLEEFRTTRKKYTMLWQINRGKNWCDDEARAYYNENKGSLELLENVSMQLIDVKGRLIKLLSLDDYEVEITLFEKYGN